MIISDAAECDAVELNNVSGVSNILSDLYQ